MDNVPIKSEEEEDKKVAADMPPLPAVDVQTSSSNNTQSSAQRNHKYDKMLPDDTRPDVCSALQAFRQEPNGYAVQPAIPSYPSVPSAKDEFNTNFCPRPPSQFNPPQGLITNVDTTLGAANMEPLPYRNPYGGFTSLARGHDHTTDSTDMLMGSLKQPNDDDATNNYKTEETEDDEAVYGNWDTLKPPPLKAPPATASHKPKSKPRQSKKKRKTPSPPSPGMDGWMTKFNLLKKYKDEHSGSADVPQKEPILGSWVNKQRMEKKKLDEGTKTSLTKQRLELLVSIDFQWAQSKGQASWERRFKELLEFKSENGSCIVPTKWTENPGEFVSSISSVIAHLILTSPSQQFATAQWLALGRWVTSQRADKKAGTIDESNERRLTAIGFVWDRYDKKVNGQEDTVEEKIVHNTRSRKRS